MSDAALPAATPARARARDNAAAIKGFVARLHLFAGLLVGPFLLVAALSGVLYALTPQIEAYVYRDALSASAGPARPLAEQAEAARRFAGPDLRLAAVRPATGDGRSTRVLFADPALGPSESRAIFVDPATLEIRGDLVSYGSSGILPLRTAIDRFHRDLLLGEPGRIYSELAASWLWVLALGGTCLWLWRRTGEARRRSPGNRALRTRHRHATVGVALGVGFLFLSATGLTWSQWGGARIGDLRVALGWTTPAVSLALGEAPAAPDGEHAHHGHGEAPASPAADDPVRQLDAVLVAARAAGIDAGAIEIRPPREAGQAWAVRENDRSWPTQVDTVAIDGRDMSVADRADFADFPLIAKLVQWGIAAHMGVLFGVANQLALAVLGLGLCASVVYGYRIWWRSRTPTGTLAASFLRMSPAARTATVALALALGWALPVLGASLLLFALADAARWLAAGRRRAPPA